MRAEPTRTALSFLSGGIFHHYCGLKLSPAGSRAWTLGPGAVLEGCGPFHNILVMGGRVMLEEVTHGLWAWGFMRFTCWGFLRQPHFLPVPASWLQKRCDQPRIKLLLAHFPHCDPRSTPNKLVFLCRLSSIWP